MGGRVNNNIPKVGITKDEYVEIMNTMAFMIHESYYDKNKWINDIFLYNMSDGDEFIQSELQDCLVKIGPIETIFGDTFEYRRNSKKLINGKLIYGND